MIFNQLRQFWLNLSNVGKVVYGAVAALLVAVVAGVGYWSSQTQYDVLFSRLPSEDASAIVERLKADRVTYQLKAVNEGTTILVPTANKEDVRMKLAAAGLPQGSGKGYELFDSMSMGATPFIQNMSYVRAIQGELARTIMTLEPVAHARVHIVQPEPTPFVREEKPVTASIVIKTKPGKTLSRANTTAIVQLTAGSVKGLAAENVTIVDTDGRVLSEKKDPRGATTSNDQLSYQREVESHLADNAQEILTRLLGPGRSVVRVTAEMSFRHLKEVSEKFDPEGKVVQREQVMSQKMTGAAPVRGPVGAVGNIPTPPPGPGPGQAATPATGPNQNSETIETEYLVSRLNLEKVEQQGVIDRLTVAVILIPQKAEGDAPEDALGITPEDARELVKQAVGFKESRGDQIQVSIGKTPGDAPPAAEALVSDDKVVAGLPFGGDYVSTVRYAALGVAGLLLLAIAVKMTRRRPSRSPSPAPAYASANSNAGAVPDELMDLQAVAATIKAWLEEPAVIRFEQKPTNNAPQARPA
jgi:flagellar M-ring protein FliF